MIISKTPFRVSFFGGGTDFPEYFNKKKARVIGTAIDKYIYIFLSKFYSNLFDHNLRIFYRENEFVKNINRIKHKVFKTLFSNEGIKKDIEIHVSSELPSFVGLGTSSSFSAGLINLINFYKNNHALNKKALAKKTISFERVSLKENVGYQDQILASYGGINTITFENNKFFVKKINPKFSLKKFNENLILVYTGIQRRASKIEKKKINNIKKNMSFLNTITDISNEAYKCFEKSNTPDFFGELLNQTWKEKKKLLNEVSNDTINEIYDKAIDAGASGGKLLGAGAGGFVLFYVKNDKKRKFYRAFNNKNLIKFRFENKGSTIIQT